MRILPEGESAILTATGAPATGADVGPAAAAGAGAGAAAGESLDPPPHAARPTAARAMRARRGFLVMVGNLRVGTGWDRGGVCDRSTPGRRGRFTRRRASRSSPGGRRRRK